MTNYKALAALGMGLLLSVAANVTLWLLWDGEQAAHQASKQEFTLKEGIYKANESIAADAIAGLRRQLRGLTSSFNEYKTKEKERQAIMAGSTPRQRTPEERERTVDNATRQKAADFLNTW